LHRHCLLKHVFHGKIEGGIEVKGRQGRRRKKLLDDHKEKKGYWEFKEETFKWITRFLRVYGHVVSRLRNA
jgi:hypothetical protein